MTFIGKGTAANQHFLTNGNGVFKIRPPHIAVTDTSFAFRRVIDHSSSSFRKLPHMSLVLKELSISGGLDVLKPREMCFFAGPGNSDGNRYSRYAILNASATNTILFIRSTLGGQVYKTANLTGTAAGWVGLACFHLHNDPAGNYNYFFAYNSTDGNLVKFVETAGGINVIETFAVGTGGSRKPIFDGTAMWMVGGNNLKRITGVFSTSVALSATTLSTGTNWSSGPMAMDTGGAVYAYRVTGSPSGALIKVNTFSPFTVTTFSGLASISGEGNMHFDGRRGMWLSTGLYMTRFAADVLPNSGGTVALFSYGQATDLGEAITYDNQVSASSRAFNNGEMVFDNHSVSSTNSLFFTNIDALPTSHYPGNKFGLGYTVSFAYKYGDNFAAGTLSNVSGLGTTNQSTPWVMFPNGSGVPEMATLFYNSTASNNANVFTTRRNPDISVHSLHVEGGVFASEFNVGSFGTFVLGFNTAGIPMIAYTSNSGLTYTLPPRPSRSVQVIIKSATAATTVNTTDGSLIDGVSSTSVGGLSAKTFLYVSTASPPRWVVIG